MNDKEKLEAIDKLVCDETETQYDSDEKITEIYNILNSKDKDKEKIEEALKLIEKFVQSGTYVSYATPRIWLKEIKEILEK